MGNNQIDKREIEIDLGQIFTELLRKIWIIILSTAVVAVLALIISMFFIKPVYESTTTVYILNKQSEVAVSNADLQMATQLTSDYEQLIKSRYVLETTITELGLASNFSALSSATKVTSPTGTRMLEITVSDTDPYTAQKIANKIRDIASKQIVDIMSIDAVNLVDEANFPAVQSSPNNKKNMLIGGLIGFVLSCGIIIIMYLVNDSMRTPDDIEHYLGISVLGIIPATDAKSKKTKKSKKSKKTEEADA